MYKLFGTSSSKNGIRVWRSLVSRLNGVQEALSSNLSTRTNKNLVIVWLQGFYFYPKADRRQFFYHYAEKALPLALLSALPYNQGNSALIRRYLI